jgi:phage terminase large subunit-like protein
LVPEPWNEDSVVKSRDEIKLLAQGPEGTTVRAWDRAASGPGQDFTTEVTMLYRDGQYFILDVKQYTEAQ